MNKPASLMAPARARTLPPSATGPDRLRPAGSDRQALRPVAVGLIGCGTIAQNVHLGLLARMPGVQMVALAETDAQRLEEAARQVPRARPCTDFAQLLALPDVEAVVVSLPNALHAEVAIAAMQAGKHVYVEKPLATNLADAREVVQVWRQTGVVGMVGFNYRCHLLHQAARQHLAAGALGQVTAVRTVFATAARARPAWKGRRDTGGGVLLDLASHHTDLVRFLFDQPIVAVSAQVRSQCSEADTATLELRLSDGVLVQSFFAYNAADEDRFEIYGTAGKLTVDRFLSLNVELSPPALALGRLTRLARGVRALVRSPYLLSSLRAPRAEPSFEVALTRFVSAVRSGRPERPDLDDGYRSLAILAAAEESARTGQVVTLPGHANAAPLAGPIPA
jgi:predicted dehydrogenase